MNNDMEEAVPTRVRPGYRLAIFPVWLAMIVAFPTGLYATVLQNDEWKPLFNGKDLEGWKQRNGQAPFEVHNGELVGTTVANEPNSFLCTEAVYKDFILEVEVLADSFLNSGIQFRSHSRPEYKNGRVHGYQMEIAPYPSSASGGIYDEGRRGWLYPMGFNREGIKAFKNGQWNKFRIECIDNTIRGWINGIPTAHLLDTESESGFIALQVHMVNHGVKAGKRVRWRNIRIKTTNLNPSPLDRIFVVNNIPNTLSAQEALIGYMLLWDGKSMQGWSNTGTIEEQGWKISDGILCGGHGDLITVGTYESIELKFEFTISPGANSGVRYLAMESQRVGKQSTGLEYEIADDDFHSDAREGKDGNRTSGSLFDLVPARKSPQHIRPVGEWNQGMIRMLPDGRVEHWYNAQKVLEYHRQSTDFAARVADSQYAEIRGFGHVSRGAVALEGNDGSVCFRSLKIKVLR